ncbi:3-keto-steroid reductase [Smittium culicis]|uniref:3-keto-steroid reductase n=1 Tax=Smittium culicis TaxID=133412 RepID=A0A1R1WXQ0_9FUNG|nr:3-keto-steroid reductase [Smittium culicis]
MRLKKGQTFATNFFGHYLLITKIRSIISIAPGERRIIWTGSNASKLDFNKTDYQHLSGDKPYESSKFITDQISVILDKDILKKDGIRSIVIEPGNVSSNILGDLNSLVLNYLVYIGFLIVRFLFGISHLTVTPKNGSYGAFRVAFLDNDDLNGDLKYFTKCNRYGKPYVETELISYDEELAQYLISEFDNLVMYTTGNK